MKTVNMLPMEVCPFVLTLLHSERQTLHTIYNSLSAIGFAYNFGLSECSTILAFLSATGFTYNFGLSECNRVCIQFRPF